VARRLHEEVFRQIDCTRCANCCKTQPPGFAQEDIDRIAGHLGLSNEAFIERYLVADQDEQGYQIETVPCPFLGSDDRCTIYDIRPKACREYPHTDKEDFIGRTYMHSSNTTSCPAVYHLVTRLRQRVRR